MENINSKRWLSIEDLDGEVWRKTKYPHLLVSNYCRLKREAHKTKVERKFGKNSYTVYNVRLFC